MKVFSHYERFQMVNKWVQQSIQIANNTGYLDKLSIVYPAGVLPRRPLNDCDKQTIKHLHETGASKDLVNFLLDLTRRGRHPFPIEHPYASICRQKRELIGKNPFVFQQLEKTIMSMRVEDIIRGCERPIDLNRVMGQAFQNWLKQYFSDKGVPFLSQSQFENYNGPAFFDGKDVAILDFARQKLGYRLERGRDFLYKTGDKFVIGEARFLSTSGGSQTRDLGETITFVRNVKGRVIGVGVLDGIVWFERRYVQTLLNLRDDEPALTVLLLDKFLESLG